MLKWVEVHVELARMLLLLLLLSLLSLVEGFARVETTRRKGLQGTLHRPLRYVCLGEASMTTATLDLGIIPSHVVDIVQLAKATRDDVLLHRYRLHQ